MGTNNDYAIVQILKNFLGKPKGDDSLSKEQWQFNCPSNTSLCRNDVDKFNLEYNSKKKMFKCWKCQPTYFGYVTRLVGDYGSQNDVNNIKILLPKDRVYNIKNKNFNKQIVNHHLITCKLPDGYLPLGKYRNTSLYKLAWDYLVNKRKISPNIIDKYEIGYTETGNRRFRIIIPSKNAFGKFNYYEARSFMKKSKIPYIKPKSSEVKKNEIIFNEYFINWDLPIFLVEGPFDMFHVPNSIPILGKELSDLLIKELIKHNSIVIFCFDPDAIDTLINEYNKLYSLGLNVFFVDLIQYNKNFIKQNFHKLKEKEKNKLLNRDIAKIFEENGKKEVEKALKNINKIDLSTQLKKILRN